MSLAAFFMAGCVRFLSPKITSLMPHKSQQMAIYGR
jgi:hypothetical protein